jgi:hypothetical protein
MAMNKILFLVVTLLAAFTVAAQEDNPLVFKDGDKVVRIEFETGYEYIELNKPTKMKVFFENVDISKTAVVGRGIKSLNITNSYRLWMVTVNEESAIDGKYKIIVQYGQNNDGSRKTCTFFVPVKI